MIDRLEAAPIIVHLVILGMASARLVWLVLDDAITHPLRRFVFERAPVGSFVGDLARCPICLSVWGLFALVPLWLMWPGVILALCIVPALALVAPLPSMFLFQTVPSGDEPPEPM